MRLRHRQAPGRFGSAGAPGGHPADRVADDAARSRPFRAVARGVRVGRHGPGPPGARFARRLGRRRRARDRPPRLGDRRVRRRRQRGPLRCRARAGLPGRRRRQLLRGGSRQRQDSLVVQGQGRDRAPGRDRQRPGLRRQRLRSRRRAGACDRQVALAVRARHARGVHDPRLRGAAPARRAAAGRVRRRILRFAGGGERRGHVGEVARRGVGPVRRRRFDARVRRRRHLRRLVLGRPLRAGSARRQRALAPGHRGRRRRDGGRRPPVLRRAPLRAARRAPGRSRGVAAGAEPRRAT